MTAKKTSNATELTEEQQKELVQALAEADRGEGVDGWQFLAELRRLQLEMLSDEVVAL
jgi:hypothetical protein